MLNIAVLVSGGGTNLQAIIDSIADGRIKDTKIGIVISNKKDAYALSRAKEAGIRAVCISKKDHKSRQDYDKAMIETIKEAEVDLIVLAGFLIVLSEDFVREFGGRIINIHPSLIPSFCGDGYYGLKVHEKVIERGVKVTGATVHFVDKGTDTGPIIMQKAVEVKNDDCPESLQRRVMEEAEWIILPKTIDAIAHGRVIMKDGRAYISDEV
ncbi:MAG: phosphoribosylglycinamide formyltransferase [Lachnospiraceae bacterium]|nr:phosphoribosylglycinamide formyltransferase [Lachnospiraceae bacterium]